MSWKNAPLSELLTVQNGYAFDSKKFSAEGDIGLIRIRDIKEGRVTDTRYTGEYEDKYIVRSGDYLIGMDGEFGCYEWKGENALLNQRVCRLEKFSSSIEPKFLLYGINKYLKDIEAVTGFTTVKHLSSKQIAQIKFPVPQVSEQKRIVEILDEAFKGIDAAIVNTEKNLANTREFFGNYIEAIFSSDDKNWTNCLIGEVCTLKSGTTVPVEIEKSDGDIPYVKVAEMTMEENLDGIYTSIRFLNYADIKKNWIIPKGATIFPKRGGAILTNKKRMLLRDICLDLNIMAVIPSDRIIPEFLYIYFLNVDMRKLGNGSSIPQINNVDIAPLKFAFPSNKDEQLKVIEEFKVIEEGYNLLLKSYEHKLNLLSELKQSLLQKAFRGELTSGSDALAEVAA